MTTTSPKSSKKELVKKIIKKSQTDFNFFAENFVNIRSKNQGIINLKLNTEQIFIHNLLQQQKHQTGGVKALILKARQVGITTLIAARNYHFTLLNRGVKSLVLAHRQSATNNIFSMLARCYSHSPFFLSLTSRYVKIRNLPLRR